MAEKRDGNRVLSILERMGMIQRVNEPQPNEPQPPDDFEPSPPQANEPESAQISAAALEDFFSDQADETGTASMEMMSMNSDTTRDAYTPESASYAEGANLSEPVRADTQPSPGASFWDKVQPRQPDTDRYMDVDELYRTFGMSVSGTDTVYLVEEYLKTLPESLPTESRRNIILKIVSASGFDFDKLLSDGIDRIARLNEYASSFAAHTDEMVARYNAELEALQQQMQHVRDLIGERKNLHKRQFLAIENEAQRLREVLDFITN